MPLPVCDGVRFKYRSPWRPHPHTFQIAALCSKNHLEDPVLETDTWVRGEQRRRGQGQLG